MKKNTKPKFTINLTKSQNKFSLIKKSKIKLYTKTQSTFVMSLKLAILKQRIQYILSLVCDFSTELNIRFCDTEEMLSTNSYYRGKNYPTDVLSFPVIENLPNQSPSNFLGDILICVPVCYNQAIKAKHTLAAELEKMIIHGILHLKGFDHERNKNAWIVMTALEKNIQAVLLKEMGKPLWCEITIQSN